MCKDEYTMIFRVEYHTDKFEINEKLLHIMYKNKVLTRKSFNILKSHICFFLLQFNEII